jgi:hypothetical protein
MNAAHDLLQQARAAGYILTPKEGGLINIRPRPTDELREAVKAHKAELLALLSSSPANDPHPSRGEVQPCAPLVSQEDLHQIMRHLLTHLATCRGCVAESHLYCSQASRTGNGYAAYLTEFPDADRIHADFVSAVIKARVWGIKRGFTELEALAHQREETGRETACRPVYGIDNRPAELAFVNHFTACAFCFPRSGKYCGEGSVLHEAALMEGVQ